MVPLELPCNGCLILFITYDQGVVQNIRGQDEGVGGQKTIIVHVQGVQCPPDPP